MKLSHLVVCEITHRKLNFALGFFSITVAAGCLVGAVLLLGADRIETKQTLANEQQELELQIASAWSIGALVGRAEDRGLHRRCLSTDLPGCQHESHHQDKRFN